MINIQNSSCPCGSNKYFSECCEPFLNSQALPETAEQLMRSRYCAFVTININYLKKTLAPESRGDFDQKANEDWAKQAKWKGLKILSTQKGGINDKKGTVEFTALYEQDGDLIEHHEVSEFRKNDQGQWFFVDGESHTHKNGEGHHEHHEKPKTVINESPRVGRNDPCPCGSDKKYKKCCGA